ncbi:MAG: efflux RND transporter periplasmic adaptor subunit [Planctomycetes bacterium]|nr:efflux RND transporter periplasmic adaptor subunit [Planctomycetota bacterium]
MDEPSKAMRSVIAQSVQPQPLDVSIKLPVTIRPKDVIELRAPVGGAIVNLPYDKGDVIPAASLPPAVWLEAPEFIDARGPEQPATDAEVALRNLRHLDGFECFARIESTQLEESLWEAQEGYDQAVRDLKRTEEYAQSTGAQLDQARTRRSMARANVNRVLAMINDTYICSPLEGVLIEKLRLEGEYVNGGELIGRVAVMKTLVADLEIPEAHRAAIQVGKEMRVDIGAIKDDAGKAVARMGKVALIDSVAHPQTHSFTVELHIDNADRALPAGIFGTVYVVIYSRPDALVVPLSALKLAGTSKMLYVAVGAEGEGTAKELRNIEIGHLGRDWAEIKGDALKPGMKVVVFGAQGLNDGDAIRWTEKDPYIMKDEGGAQ